MPSFQYVIYTKYDTTKFSLIAFENLSSTAWLKSYRPTKGITYPVVFDSTGGTFSTYKVGISFGNPPPSYLLIDKKGIVRYRTDAQYNVTGVIDTKISELLAEP